MHSTRSKGFTLTEIMIVVAIIGIIAAIAYPSYQDSVRKSRRADARAVLLEAAQFMERRYTENLQAGYGAANQAALDNAGLGFSPKQAPPPNCDNARKNNCYYSIVLVPDPVNPQNAFILNAQPQATAGQNQDRCGGLTGPTLNLNQAGQKGVNGAFNTPAIIQECWR
jgi:type IV pilus assembly protein PilE